MLLLEGQRTEPFAAGDVVRFTMAISTVFATTAMLPFIYLSVPVR
jgi:hypothetical protein